MKSPKSANIKPTPSCQKCKKNLTAVKFPGVICTDCKTSIHFVCSTIDKDTWPLYSDKQNPKVYLCTDCTKRQRRSALYSATAAGGSSSSVTPQRSAVTTTTEKDDDIKALREQLALVLQELQEAKARISQLESQKPNQNSTNPQPSTEGTAFFTINGIPATEEEEIHSIVEGVLSLKTPDFKLDGTAKVTRLKSNNQNHHSILIGVRRGFPLFKTFNAAKGSIFKGVQAGFPTVQKIYLNESHTSLSYRLFKKTKALKDKGYRFVWIRNSRVFARKTESSKIWPINNEDVLEKLLNPQG